MKRIYVYIIFLMLALGNCQLYAQDLIYPEVIPYLSDVQKEKLQKANELFLKSVGNENNAEAIDRKYIKLKQKSKNKKWEKQTWEAKKYRILAIEKYMSACQIINKLYSDLITTNNFISENNKKKALKLNKEANLKLELAKKEFEEYANIQDKELETLNYEELNKKLNEIKKLNISGIQYQISALETFIDNGISPQEKEQEVLDWQKAQEKNTLTAYYEYMDKNPRGKNISQANMKIKKLEKSNNKNTTQKDVAYNRDESSNMPSKDVTYNRDENSNIIGRKSNNNTKEQLIFRVQIAASKVKLAEWFVKSKAPGANQIKMIHTGDWYKYMVGEFTSYNEAAQYRDKLYSTAPDAFIVVFKNGKQIQVTNKMKQ